MFIQPEGTGVAHFDLADSSVVVVIGSGAGGGTFLSNSLLKRCKGSLSGGWQIKFGKDIVNNERHHV